MKRALVVGFGSIGSRHARVLATLGCEVGVVSRREVEHPLRFASLREGLDRHSPDYVVLASETHLHLPQLGELARYQFVGTTLVEKPLFHESCVATDFLVGNVLVAYNLRFHPILQALRDRLSGERVLSVQAYAGQYLPDWRPDSDYKKSYSASAARGGGVLRDLSHEVDFLAWMLGGWTQVTALGGRYSDLNIDSDDVFACLFSAPRCPVVSVQLNYLDRLGRRSVLVNTAAHTFEADFVSSTLRIDREIMHFKVERDDTYCAMHEAVRAGDLSTVCTFEEGMRTLRFIEGARSAAIESRWVVNV